MILSIKFAYLNFATTCNDIRSLLKRILSSHSSHQFFYSYWNLFWILFDSNIATKRYLKNCFCIYFQSTSLYAFSYLLFNLLCTCWMMNLSTSFESYIINVIIIQKQETLVYYIHKWYYKKQYHCFRSEHRNSTNQQPR